MVNIHILPLLQQWVIHNHIQFPRAIPDCFLCFLPLCGCRASSLWKTDYAGDRDVAGVFEVLHCADDVVWTYADGCESVAFGFGAEMVDLGFCGGFLKESVVDCAVNGGGKRSVVFGVGLGEFVLEGFNVVEPFFVVAGDFHVDGDTDRTDTYTDICLGH